MNVHVSAGFKQMTTKAIVAIVMFILVYLLLIALSIGLMFLCVFGGLAIIVAKTMIITIALGIGMASLGIFILVFLFKFLFKKHTKDRAHFMEINYKSEPKLVGFINDIVREVETDFPHKIYISGDVNAGVFYDSSFWSMFFPVKKNLQIGLGLVNSITEDEFKAILAHEFGHFSQRTMKVGSYVHNVNQIIYNMLYDNEEFELVMNKWAQVHGAFSVFVAIGLQIIKGIQWILRQMYEVINIRYMALSREMEFHADEVAANVAGYIPLKESLLRFDFATYAYSAVLDFYSGKIPENITSKNMYKEHSFVMNFHAQRNQIPTKNGLPDVDKNESTKYNKSKLSFQSQWESHPSTEDRILALEKLNIIKESTGDQPAMLLFSNPERLQEKLTAMLFSQVSYTNSTTDFDIDTFERLYTESVVKNSFHTKYNSYYDNKNPIPFDPESVIDSTSPVCTPEECFSKENVDMVYELIALENDRTVVKSIADNETTVTTFDYDGRKYAADEAPILLTKLVNAIEALKQKIAWHDIEIYRCFYDVALRQGRQEELKNAYNAFFLMDKVYDKKGERYIAFRKSLEFINTNTPVEEIEVNFTSIAAEEADLKSEIRQMLSSELLRDEITPTIAENLKKYCDNELVYFRNKSYNNDAITILMTAAKDYAYLNARNYFLSKKSFLNLQIGLVEAS